MVTTSRRLLAGLLVALGMLALLEGALRLVIPPPERAPQLHTRWTPGEAFARAGEQVVPVFQGVDERVPVFEAIPSRLRVMVFGGSSVRAGSSLGHDREFPALVERALRSRGQDVEVLNLGRPAMESVEIRDLVEEAVVFGPDVAVIYTGHNDVGNLYMQRVAGGAASSVAARLRHALGGFALARATRRVATAISGPAHVQAAPLDPERRAAIASALEANLEAAVTTLTAAGAEVVLVTPISDFARGHHQVPGCLELLPGAWHHSGDQWHLDTRVPAETVARALEQEPTCPEALLIRGTQRLEAGDRGGVDDLRAARDNATIPVLATEENLEAIRSVARRTGAHLVDLEAELVARHGVPPRALFVDNVHFSAQGHRRVAATLGPVVAKVLDGR